MKPLDHETGLFLQRKLGKSRVYNAEADIGIDEVMTIRVVLRVLMTMWAGNAI